MPDIVDCSTDPSGQGDASSIDYIMEEWKSFFDLKTVNDQKKAMHAMSKLTGLLLVQYMKFRKAYDEEVFVKRRHREFYFYIFSRTTMGNYLNNVLKTVASHIESMTVRSFRFQNYIANTEVIEEICFEFRYNDNPELTVGVGDVSVTSVQFGNLTFDKFFGNFVKMLANLQNYCSNLTELPDCAKYFRTSFYQPGLPKTISLNEFSDVAHEYVLSQNIIVLDVGSADLPHAGIDCTLRSCCATRGYAQRIRQQEAEVMKELKSRMYCDAVQKNVTDPATGRNEAGDRQAHGGDDIIEIQSHVSQAQDVNDGHSEASEEIIRVVNEPLTQISPRELTPAEINVVHIEPIEIARCSPPQTETRTVRKTRSSKIPTYIIDSESSSNDINSDDECVDPTWDDDEDGPVENKKRRVEEEMKRKGF